MKQEELDLKCRFSDHTKQVLNNVNHNVKFYLDTPYLDNDQEASSAPFYLEGSDSGREGPNLEHSK